MSPCRIFFRFCCRCCVSSCCVLLFFCWVVGLFGSVSLPVARCSCRVLPFHSCSKRVASGADVSHRQHARGMILRLGMVSRSRTRDCFFLAAWPDDLLPRKSEWGVNSGAGGFGGGTWAGRLTVTRAGCWQLAGRSGSHAHVKPSKVGCLGHNMHLNETQSIAG